MSKASRDKKKTAEKAHSKSKTNGVSIENQNQGHNTQKDALGQNTKR